MARRLRIAWALVLAVTAVCPATMTDAASPNTCPANATWAKGTWPAPPATSQGATGKPNWVALHDATHSLLATNGNTIHRSIDGGCSWTQVFDAATALDGLNTVSVSVQAYLVFQLVTPPYPGDPKRVYAIIAPSSLFLLTAGLVNPPTFVAESTDAGRTWTLHDELTSLPSLPECDTGFDVIAAVAASAPDVLYLVCSASYTQNGEALFRSGDGGVTWTNLPVPFPIAFGQVMVVDPGNASTVFFAERVYPVKGGPENIVVSHTTDAGQHWSSRVVQPKIGDGPPVGLDVSRQGHTTHVLAYSTAGGVSESTDDGVTWRRVGRLIRGGPFVIGASYLAASGDIAVWEQIDGYGSDGTVHANCGSSVTLTIYRGSRRVAHRVPVPSTPWGRVAGFTSQSWFWYFGAYGDSTHETGPGSTEYLGGWYFESGKCPTLPTLVPIVRFTRR